MILTLPDATQIDSGMVDRMLAELARGCPPHRHRAIVRQITAIGTRLDTLRIDLAGPEGAGGKLGAGYDYLQRDDDDARFALWTGWIDQYVTCCDAQAAIRDRLAGEVGR